MIYKIKRWWQHLGLVLLGFFYSYNFNLSLFYYLFLGFSLVAFGHAFCDKKKSSIFYFAIVLILSLYASPIQLLATTVLLVMYAGYLKVQYFPISAIYKGTGWSLLFLLPIKTLDLSSILFYFLLVVLTTVSEIFHEAYHYENDKKEGRTTTAIMLKFKINKEQRLYGKIIIISIGILLLTYLILG